MYTCHSSLLNKLSHHQNEIEEKLKQIDIIMNERINHTLEGKNAILDEMTQNMMSQAENIDLMQQKLQ